MRNHLHTPLLYDCQKAEIQLHNVHMCDYVLLHNLKSFGPPGMGSCNCSSTPSFCKRGVSAFLGKQQLLRVRQMYVLAGRGRRYLFRNFLIPVAL